MTVEFLRAWEDQTWDTEVIEIPPEGLGHRTLHQWANEVLSQETRYRRVVLWAVYSVDPEGDREDSGRRDPSPRSKGDDDGVEYADPRDPDVDWK